MTTKIPKDKKGKEQGVKPSVEELRLAAYYYWLSRGCPPGEDLADWLAVEEEFKEEANSRSTRDV